MVRYIVILLAIASFFIAGCFARPYTLDISIHNDCGVPIVLHDPYSEQGESIEIGAYASKGVLSQRYILARRYSLSHEEYEELVKKFFNSDTELTAEMPDGEEIKFTLRDIYANAERPDISVVKYSVCKSQDATEVK